MSPVIWEVGTKHMQITALSQHLLLEDSTGFTHQLCELGLLWSPCAHLWAGLGMPWLEDA